MRIDTTELIANLMGDNTTESDIRKFIEKRYEPIEDMPGYVWFNKRNMQIISIDKLIKLLKAVFTNE